MQNILSVIVLLIGLFNNPKLFFAILIPTVLILILIRMEDRLDDILEEAFFNEDKMRKISELAIWYISLYISSIIGFYHIFSLI